MALTAPLQSAFAQAHDWRPEPCEPARDEDGPPDPVKVAKYLLTEISECPYNYISSRARMRLAIWRAAHRGLDRALFQRLAQGEWIERQQNLLITGPTGVGKTWLACALGQRACRDNRSVLYQRVPRMLEGLSLARGDGRY